MANMEEGELSYNSRKVMELEKSLGRKPTWQEMLAEIDEYKNGMSDRMQPTATGVEERHLL